jgi:hypothetical protein
VNRLRQLLLVALLLVWAGRVHAAHITILRPPRSSPEHAEALFRLKGELLALGLKVEIADRPARRAPDQTDPRAGLERMAAERGIDAIIDVVGEAVPTAVDIWIFQRSPRRTEVSRVQVEPSARNAAETLAIRAIEVLRSNFVEIDLAARAQLHATVSPPPPEQVPPPPPPAQGLGLEAGAAVLTSLDGVGPAILPLVRFGWAANTWLAVQATVAGFGTRPTVEAPTGSARVAQQYAVLGLCYCSASDSGIRPLVSLSAGALRTSLEGEADAPEEGHRIERWSFLVDGSLGAQLGLSGRYHLTLASHVHMAEPSVAVHLVDTLVATTGRPNLVMSLTVGAWL